MPNFCIMSHSIPMYEEGLVYPCTVANGDIQYKARNQTVWLVFDKDMDSLRNVCYLFIRFSYPFLTLKLYEAV